MRRWALVSLCFLWFGAGLYACRRLEANAVMQIWLGLSIWAAIEAVDKLLLAIELGVLE